MTFLCGSSMRSSFRVNLLTTAGVLWLSLFACGAQVEAGIIVTFGASVPDPIIAGSSGTVDVYVRANAGTQTLDAFLVRVGLTPIAGSPAGGVIFSAAQAEAQLGQTSYVFFGISQSQNTMTGIGTVSGSGSLYTGMDASDDGSSNPMPVILTTTNRLLYRLNLTGVAAGTYAIDVNSDVSSFYSDQLDGSSTITYSSTAGSLTVNGAASVPEPASMAFLLIAFAAVALRQRFCCQQIA